MQRLNCWKVATISILVVLAIGIGVILIAQMEPEEDEDNCEWYLDWSPVIDDASQNLNINAFYWTNCGDVYHFHRDYFVFGEDESPSITVQKVLP